MLSNMMASASEKLKKRKGYLGGGLRFHPVVSWSLDLWTSGEAELSGRVMW